MSDPDRPDLRMLDPRQEPERWERMVAVIMARAAGELQRRARAHIPTPLESLVAWTRPALAAAAALALISLAALSRNAAIAADPGARDPAAFFASGGLPAPVTGWLQDGQPPVVSELAAMEGDF